jgi:hypothetical protein
MAQTTRHKLRRLALWKVQRLSARILKGSLLSDADADSDSDVDSALVGMQTPHSFGSGAGSGYMETAQ